jgi:ABC-type transport system substrate-binding protein
MRKAQSTPGLSTANYNQSVIHATWVNNKKKPLDDPRVRRAMHLALDRPVLAEVVKDVAPMSPGSFIYPFSEYATPKEELAKRLGYQPDPAASIKEARALLAAAGYPNGIDGLDYMVRDIAIFKLWSQAIQAMLKEALNVQCDLRTVVESVWFDDAASGHFDLAIGAVAGTLLDPSDSFSAWYGKDGPQNYSFWDNMEFQALTPRIDREIDPAKTSATGPPGRSHHGAGPAAAAGRLGTDQRDLVQLRQESQPGRLFRHLRRRALGYSLARQGMNHATFDGYTCGVRRCFARCGRR